MRSNLPSGTVTFLFTDIEGSTKLLHELGADVYSEALGDHRRVLREAFAANGGIEVDTQGDAFFVAFPTAPGALAAAASATEALRPGRIHVRMGIHTGRPLVTDDGYVGPDVHRAARIAAAGHGGQVLVSKETRDVLEGDFADDPGRLIDLGEHRLKDIAAPVWIFQLGSERFAPLATISNTGRLIGGPEARRDHPRGDRSGTRADRAGTSRRRSRDQDEGARLPGRPARRLRRRLGDGSRARPGRRPAARRGSRAFRSTTCRTRVNE